MCPLFRVSTIPLLLTALLCGLPVAASGSSEVEFARAVLYSPAGREATSLQLCSTGTLRYKRVIRAYEAALYREDCSDNSGDLAASPIRPELSYFWSIDGRKFGEAAEALLKETLDSAEFGAIEARMRELHERYQTVSPGDRYALTWVPGRGTELALNSRTLATIGGEDFARAYFDLWLGETPMDEKLRNALLARSERN